MGLGQIKVRDGDRRQEFGSQISLSIVKEIIEVDDLNQGSISGRQPSVEDKRLQTTTFCGPLV